MRMGGEEMRRVDYEGRMEIGEKGRRKKWKSEEEGMEEQGRRGKDNMKERRMRDTNKGSFRRKRRRKGNGKIEEDMQR